jgi:hypothetical protein
MKQKFDRRPGTPQPRSVITRAGDILARAAAKLLAQKPPQVNLSRLKPRDRKAVSEEEEKWNGMTKQRMQERGIKPHGSVPRSRKGL